MRYLLLIALAVGATACELEEECAGEGEVRFAFTKASQSDEALYLTGDVEWIVCDAPEDDEKERRSYAFDLTDGASQRVDAIPASEAITLEGDRVEFSVSTGSVTLIDNAKANINVKDLHVGDLVVNGKTYDLWADVSRD